jgi:hypothetical protein
LRTAKATAREYMLIPCCARAAPNAERFSDAKRVPRLAGERPFPTEKASGELRFARVFPEKEFPDEYDANEGKVALGIPSSAPATGKLREAGNIPVFIDPASLRTGNPIGEERFARLFPKKELAAEKIIGETKFTGPEPEI